MAYKVLLDTSSLMYRAHFAMRDVITAPDGRKVGAVHGYLDMTARLIATRHPDEVVHVYDHDWRPTARTSIYPAYKSKRPPEPDGLGEQFAMLRQVLDLTGMSQAQTPSWEAEDAIGALVEQAAPDDRLDMISGDRDLLQLVRDAPPPVRLLFIVRGVSDLHEFDEAAVVAKYGVPARRYAEFAILRGDPSDDLPGIPGVGEKTAKSLIAEYGDLDELIADANTAFPAGTTLAHSKRLKAKVRESAGYLDQMRRIVPVNAVAPLAVWSGPRQDDALRAMADRDGFRGPAQRLLAALDAAGS